MNGSGDHHFIFEGRPFTIDLTLQNSRKAYQKLQNRYTGKTMIIKLDVLNTFLSSKLHRGVDMGNQVANLDSYF